jgi:hypothetical protein
MPRRSFSPSVVAIAITVAAAVALAAAAARADEAPTPAPTPDSGGYGDSIDEYFANWFQRSDAAKASQPHWMTPLVTVTPRLEQEFRYDQYWQRLGNGANIDQYDAGKGLELIPTYTNEVLINLPPYLDRSIKKPASGWNDWQFLVVKQRLLSANEESGNYIVTAFLGVQAPTGDPAFTNHAWVITPTIAAGKGWGDFDIQSTLSVSVPTSHGGTIGTALLWNTTFQYHIAKVFWPEFETNLTHWYGGERDGKTQLFLTAGLILGRFQLYGRANLAIGAGYQFAVTPKLTETPVLTPVYDHAWLLSARVPF